MNSKTSLKSAGGAFVVGASLLGLAGAACGGTTPEAQTPQMPAAVATTDGAQVPAAPAVVAAPVKDAPIDHRAVQEHIAGEIVDKMDAGEFGAARRPFDEKMRSAITTNQLRQVWAQIVGQMGLLRGHTVRSVQTKGGLEVLLLDCELERGHAGVQVAFDGDDKVAGLFIQPVK